MYYKFKCVNPTDFELLLSMHVKSRFFQKVFIEAQKKMLKDKGQEVKGDANLIDRFEVEPKFHNLISTAVSKQRREVFKIVKRDGINILNNKVLKCTFERQPNRDWEVKIILGGVYAKRGKS